MAHGFQGDARDWDPDRGRQLFQSVPDYARPPSCQEVFQDHTPMRQAIKERFEGGGGQVYHDLQPDQARF
eukprot:6635891-Lingulodinium_polyedra.AAC.1